MVKQKKKNMVKSGGAPKVGLEQQITEGKVIKKKTSSKFRLRAEEKEVKKTIWT